MLVESRQLKKKEYVMRRAFVQSTLATLVADHVLTSLDSILVVCDGDAECLLFVEMGFSNVVISNLDERMLSDQFAPLDWSFQDAQNLTYEDASFDFVFVSDGLHHCASPHRQRRGRALLFRRQGGWSRGSGHRAGFVA